MDTLYIWLVIHEYETLCIIVCEYFVFSDITWIEILIMTIIADKYNLVVKLTPTVDRFTVFLNGNIEDELKEVPLNFDENYIYYLKQKAVERSVKYDKIGVEKVRAEIATSKVNY